MRKIIISLAPIAASTPINKDLLTSDVKKCVDLGASMCHLHCRTQDGSLTPDTSFMIECFESILSKSDIVVQASTGGISSMSIKQRCNPLEYSKVESASLNGGTTNLGEYIYINSFEDIKYCSEMVYKYNIIPEIEVFDIGMIHNMNLISQKQPFHYPMIFNLVFGHIGGMQPTIDSLIAFRSMVPTDAIWGVTHFGRDNWDFLAAAIALGASIVRIGFEDSNYITNTKKASFNYELVEKLATLITAMDFEIATPSDTRKLMGILK